MCQTEGETSENKGGGDASGANTIVSGRTAKGDACLPPTRVKEETVAEMPPPSRPAQRTIRAQKVAVIALVSFVVVAVGVRCSQLGDASSWWSVDELRKDEAMDVTRGQDPHTEEARKCRPWCRRTDRSKPTSSSVEATLQEGQDLRRRRKAQREPPPAASHEASQKQKPEKRCRKKRPEYDLTEKEKQRGLGGVEGLAAESPREHRKNWLQNAWRKLWRRVIRKGRGRQPGVGYALGAGAEAEGKARILEEFRDMVRRHPGDLLRRAREVRHDLDDGMLIRYLDMGLWSLEPGGNPLTEAIESTLRWREEVAPHLITDTDVVEEAKDGKIYVRGHDRGGRPVIFYTPGLEQSFNTHEGLKLLYHTLEKATALLPRGQAQFAVVADCAGFGPSKVPPLEMINIAFSTLEQHYTMRLGYVMIVNASGPITVVWKIISSVLPERTKEKIVFVTKKEALATLNRHIDPSVLPSTLPGGLDSFRYSNDAYLLT